VDKFNVGETVICWRNVKNEGGILTDPDTSMGIAINKRSPSYETGILNSTKMIKTGGVTGIYHYDFDTTGKEKGIYEAVYTATDGTRITIEKEEFKLE